MRCTFHLIPHLARERLGKAGRRQESRIRVKTSRKTRSFQAPPLLRSGGLKGVEESIRGNDRSGHSFRPCKAMLSLTASRLVWHLRAKEELSQFKGDWRAQQQAQAGSTARVLASWIHGRILWNHMPNHFAFWILQV